MTSGNLPEAFSLSQLSPNGISVRAAVEGDGPLVIMVHGWPELWYSWRHQIKPIAAAGYRVVAPDVRGYGGSDKPHPVEAYNMATMMADVVGLIDTLGEEKAILVGHDWGAPICWNTAALHPGRVAAVVGLSVPYRQRPPVSSIAMWRQLYQDKFFYQLYFQDEGVAERELEADVRLALRKIYYSISGNAPSLDSWLQRPPSTSLLGAFTDPDPFPAWMSPADLDYFVENFEVICTQLCERDCVAGHVGNFEFRRPLTRLECPFLYTCILKPDGLRCPSLSCGQCLLRSYSFSPK